jgi:transcription termination factor NusB
MITRREARSIVIQTLFHLEFKNSVDIETYYKYSINDLFDAKEDDGEVVERIDNDVFSFDLLKGI